MAFYVINAGVLIVALWSRGGLAEIQVNPSNLALSGGGTGSVDVICRLPSGITAMSIAVIRISRNTTLQPSVNQGLAGANAYSATTQGKAVLASGGLSSNVATVSGSISERSVTLTMKQVDCQYAGVYYCSITYNTGTEDYPVSHLQEDSQNLTVTCSFAQLTLTPSELRLVGGASTGSVQISCGYSPATTVYTLSVSRFRPQFTEKILAVADATVSGGQAALAPNSGLTQATATVSGSTIQKLMSLTLTQAGCNDAAMYRCSVLYKTGTAAPTEIDYYSNLTVTIPPQNVTMTVDPQIEVGNYTVGTIVTFLCNAVIGSYDPSVQTTWSWEYQEEGSGNWTPYPNSSDITTGSPFQGTSQCQYHQTSTLERNLTIDDSQRTYRCTVRRGSDTAHDTYTLGAVDYTDALAQLTLNPSELRLVGGASTGSVRISCGFSAATTVYTLSVSRFRPQSTEKILAVADATVSGGQAALAPNSGLTQATATVSGSTSQKSMSLTMTQAGCDDAAMYCCFVLYRTGTAAIKHCNNLTVTIPPGNVTMTVDPQIEVGNYTVGTVVTFLCNAMIGSYDPSVQTTWSWEYQEEGSGSWTPYPNSSDITTASPFQGTSQCQYQTSRLERNLTIGDSRSTYRCTVRRGSDTAHDNYTLGVVDYTDDQTPAPHTSASTITTEAPASSGRLSAPGCWLQSRITSLRVHSAIPIALLVFCLTDWV